MADDCRSDRCDADGGGGPRAGALRSVRAVLGTLHPEFRLLDDRGSISCEELRRKLAGLTDGTAVLWVEWTHLASDDDRTYGHGDIVMVDEPASLGVASDLSGARIMVSTPSAVVVEYEGDLMRTEWIYANRAATRHVPLPAGGCPMAVELAAMVG